MTEEQFKELRDLLREIYEAIVHISNPEAKISWKDD